jgi:hypothetical protein
MDQPAFARAAGLKVCNRAGWVAQVLDVQGICSPVMLF